MSLINHQLLIITWHARVAMNSSSTTRKWPAIIISYSPNVYYLLIIQYICYRVLLGIYSNHSIRSQRESFREKICNFDKHFGTDRVWWRFWGFRGTGWRRYYSTIGRVCSPRRHHCGKQCGTDKYGIKQRIPGCVIRFQ